MKLSTHEKLEQANTAYKKKEFELAESLYREILKDKPSQPDANHNLGILLASLNKHTEALSLFKTATQNKTIVEQYWISYINFLIEQKNFIEAELACKKALEFHPKSPLIYLKFGSILYILNRPDDASVKFKKAIELQPEFAEAHFNLGILFYKFGKFNEAITSYKKSIKLKPDYADAHNNLGNTLFELNKFDEAEKYYKKTIELKPDYAEAYNNLGNTLYKMDRFIEAEINYKRTLKLKPNDADTYNNLAITVRKLKRSDEALTLLGKAAELDPLSAKIYENLALTYRDLKKFDEAELYFKKSIEFNSDFLVIANYIDQGDWDNSKKFLENFCIKKVLKLKVINDTFLDRWIVYSYKILKQNNLKKFIKIFSKLFFIYERNNSLNDLINFLYENNDIKTILELTELDDKILIKVSYSKYKFMSENFLLAEELAASNINDASNLMRNPDTEDLGLFIVRISLTLYKDKILARKSLNNFIVNSKLNK